MKFEVRYPTGARHEVELEGTLAVLGRDPSCDLVLNDVKCSRRHAVIEAGPQGMAIRDSGSANGVYVNGKRVERSVLEAGDAIRLGEIVIKVLPEEVGGTMVMGAEELESIELPTPARPVPAPAGPVKLGTPPPDLQAPPPPRERPAPRPRGAAQRPLSHPRRRVGPLERPLTVTLLAALWGLAALLYLGAAGYLVLAGELSPVVRFAGGGLLAVLAMLGAVLCVGLLGSRAWARGLQIGVAAIGILNCPFSLAAIAVLVYLLRADVRLRFSGRDWSELSDEESALLDAESAEGAFAATIVGGALLGAVLSGGLAYWASQRSGARTAGSDPHEKVVLVELRQLATAQRNFREGTAGDCGNGFADLEGLIEPMRVIPSYRSDGPAFLSSSFRSAERNGYRFTFETEEALAAREGCPTRTFRRYRYLADPLIDGRHFLLASDGAIHVARDRPASTDDPTLD